MKKKLATGIALILALLAVLSACASGEPAQSTEPSTDPADSSIVLFSADTSYTIIRGEYAKEPEIQAAVKLRNALKETMTGIKLFTITTDFSLENKKNETVDVPGAEILIGNTNRRESRDIIASLKNTEYVIKTVNDKLVITGGNEFSTEEAVRIFIEDYLPLATADRFALDGPIELKGECSKEGPELDPNASYRLMSWNLGCAVGNLDDVVSIWEKYLPDIIALQECNPNSYRNGVEKFTNRHTEYKVATRYHGDGTSLYTPILYNTDYIKLVSSGCEWLRSRYTGTGTKSIGWAVFEIDGQRFAVLNFHGAVISTSYKGFETMPAEERSNLSAEWRYDNAQQLIELKNRIFKLNGEIPITINGDCNFSNTGRAFSVFTADGFTDSETTADKIIDAGYKTAYSYGNSIPGKGQSIDHIVGRSGIHFYVYDIIREDPVMTASDHCPVYVDIGFDLPTQ